MVQEVYEMPWEGEYRAAATAALLRFGADTLRYTQSFYAVRNEAGEIILGAGVALWSFARPPELWIMLAKPFLRNLRRSVLLAREALLLPAAQYHGLVCDVARDDRAALHFASACGFEPSGRPSLRPNGSAYLQFKVS